MFAPPVLTVFGGVHFRVFSRACTVVSIFSFKKLGQLGTIKGLVEKPIAIPICNTVTDGQKQPLGETSSLAGIKNSTASSDPFSKSWDTRISGVALEVCCNAEITAFCNADLLFPCEPHNMMLEFFRFKVALHSWRKGQLRHHFLDCEDT